MRVKICIIIALFICLLLAVFSVDAQIKRSISGLENAPASTATGTLPSPYAEQGIGNSQGTTQGSAVPLHYQKESVFDQYVVNYYTDLPQIDCYIGEDVIGQINYVGTIWFYPDNTDKKPINHIRNANGIPTTDTGWGTSIHIYYPISQFENVMNMLRYSNKTLTLRLIDDGQRGGLQSSLSPNRERVGMNRV